MSTMQVLGVGYRAARAAARERRRTRPANATRASGLVAAVAEHGLTILAGGCFTAAAAMVTVPLGLAVAGVALLVLELRAGER
jgi:hypothetical protein